MTDAIIHLRVPAATKGRWVRASRAAGMRLTDWIVQAVEGQRMTHKLTIPPDLTFGDLRLARDPDGAVSFDTAAVERVYAASGLPLELLHAAGEDGIASLIVAWYRAHRQQGGAPDPIAEDLIAEAKSEDSRGAGISHQPGRA